MENWKVILVAFFVLSLSFCAGLFIIDKTIQIRDDFRFELEWSMENEQYEGLQDWYRYPWDDR